MQVTPYTLIFNNSNVSLCQYSMGNPKFDPEQATTVAHGGVFTPTFLPGLQLSVDWYSIDNKDAIAQLGAQVIVNN